MKHLTCERIIKAGRQYVESTSYTLQPATIPTGWKCPRCRVINAPSLPKCGCEAP